MIEFDRVSRRYGDLDAIRNLNMTLARGEKALLTCHSGAGKSTLLRVLLLLDRPTGGEIRVNANAPRLSRPGLYQAIAVALGWCFKSIVCCSTGVSTITWPCHW